MISAQSSLASVPSLGAKESAALAAAGFVTVDSLLDYLPKRYEDRRMFDHFPNQAGLTAVCLRGRIVDTASRRFGGTRSMFEAVVMDESGGVFGSGRITCRWFNLPFIHKWLAAGQEVIVFGKVRETSGKLHIDHPEVEVLRDDDDPVVRSIHVERIVPIYRNITGLTQRRLRSIIHELLELLDPATVVSPQSPVGDGSRAQLFRTLHFPDSIEDAQAARRQLAFEEFFAIQLNVAWRRQLRYGLSGRVLGKRTGLLTAFYRSLPFDLTGAQKRSIREIIADMREARPMARLLQGDVGSGKTLVALAAMLMAVDSACQAALMAPTQILAEQHFLTFTRWVEPLGIRVLLRTAQREAANYQLGGGQSPQIIIGTHALLYDADNFTDLGLVVIDEQHKFGVEQRAALVGQGTSPDVLVMTATPIPRTLTMTLYGDLDVSVLDEKPPGRGQVVTALRVAPKQNDVNAFIREHLAAGRQAYLVYPLVNDSELLDVQSATAEYAKWQKRLSGHDVGLLHGQLRADEKEDVMRRFRDGEVRALVATSVIEVGMDVANASVMVLYHAERFGLAQLHQLRGRIGRGSHKSYCILITDGKSPEAIQKLNVLTQCSDGFEIAEADLRLRGPGDLLGTLQSGVSEFRFPEFLADLELLREARAQADRILAADPRLEGAHAALRALINQPSPNH